MREEIFEYLQRLGTHLTRKGGAQMSSVSVPVGNGRMLLSPQMQELLITCADGEPEATQDYRDFVLEGIGLEVKCLGELRDAERADEDGLPMALALLAENLELIADLQLRIHDELRNLTETGEIEQAKSLAEYRKRLVPLTIEVEEAARRLDPLIEVQGVTEALIPTIVEETAAQPVDLREKPQRHSDYERDRRRAAEKADDARSAILEKKTGRLRQLKLLAVAFGIFAITGLVLWAQFGSIRSIAELNPIDFDDQKAIIRVVSRPPELILVADDKKWSDLSKKDREQMVGLLIPRIEVAGYKTMRLVVGIDAHAATWKKGSEPVVK